jgi:hypothetical protein
MADAEQRDVVWEEGGSSLEIRKQGELPDGRPAPDEIVARGAFVHLEQMAQAGGKHLHLNFGVQDGRLWVRLSDQGDENIEWEGDNRETPIPGVDECQAQDFKANATRRTSSSTAYGGSPASNLR